MKNKVLEGLIRQTPITEEEWLTLIQGRRYDIAKHMKSVTLLTLGEIPFLDDYFGPHHLKRDTEYLETGTEYLDLRGVFPTGCYQGRLSSHIEYERNDEPQTHATATHHTFWGINREGKWILVKVYATITREPYKNPSRFERITRARRIDVTVTEDCSLICKECHIDPQKVWNRLGEVLTEWINQRESLLRELRFLEKKFSNENLFLESVPTK